MWDVWGARKEVLQAIALNPATSGQRAFRSRLFPVLFYTWWIYPLIWIFAEGTGRLTPVGEASAYMVLDIISKTYFGYCAMCMIPAWMKPLSGDPRANLAWVIKAKNQLDPFKTITS